ncbi:MAG: transposase, partial [Rhizobacter sp.]|nr:transposase [Chlorobiales bacterium]
QYTSQHYQTLLTQAGVLTSMTQDGNCYHNALAERINGILKGEFLLSVYRTVEEAETAVAESVWIYNHYRPHTALGYLTPQQVHQQPRPTNQPVSLDHS